MVEGDLADLTLPSLLQAVSRECSTAVLRLCRGGEAGAMYFSAGVLVHAQAGSAVGDEAACVLLAWPDGRFQLARDPETQPRTVSARLARIVGAADPGSAGTAPSRALAIPGERSDDQLLSDLLTQLSHLEQEKVRLEESRQEIGAVPALLLVTAVVNSMVDVVTARCGDPGVLPSRVLPRLADQHPYTQLLGEERDRISIVTAAGVLKTWNSKKEDRERLFLDLCRALLDVLTFYGNTASTFFRSPREREEWRATFGVFVEGLWTAVHRVEGSV